MANRSNSSRRLCVIAAAAAAASLGGAAVAVAQTNVSWVGAAGSALSYNDPANWSSGVTPANANNEFLMINNGGTATVSGTQAAEGAFLNLGLQPGNSGRLEISGGTLTLGEFRVGGREVIPDVSNPPNTIPNGGGTGSVLQTGGTVNVNFQDLDGEPPIQSLYVGDAGLATGNTANGSYTITSGSLTSGVANDDAIVVGTGPGTVGTFVQQGGDVTSTGFVIVGRRGASASYTMSAGTLKAQGLNGLWVGDGANADASAAVAGTTGTFTQTGGDIDTAAGVQVGRRSSSGVYNMSGGTLDIGSELILAGATATTNAALLNGTADFNLSGNAAITIGTNLNVALTPSTTAGTNNATLDMTGGSITFNATNAIFAVGNGLGAVGTVNHSAGTISIPNTSGNGVNLGRNNASGTYNLSGTAVLSAGTITMESGVNAANPTAFRHFNISGGTLTANIVNLGSAATTAVRSVNVSGGNVTVGTYTMGQSATTYISGGSFNITTNLSMTSTSTLRTSVPLSLATPIALGNVTIQVDASELQLSGPISSPSGGRTITKTGPGTLTLSNAWSFNATTPGTPAITNTAGVVNLDANPGSPTAQHLGVNANGTTNFRTAASYNLRSLAVGTGATATLLNNGSANRVINATTVSVTGGKLDLKNNKLITTTPAGTASAGVYDGVQGMVQSARNGGAWDGNGITTSEPDAATGLTSIGVATGAQIRGLGPTATDVFAGQTITGASTIAMYTYAGDANLDGQITGDDYSNIDFNIAVPGASGYYNGDFNYDGIISGDDYSVIDFNIAAQGAPFPTSTAAEGLSVTAVPEPASACGFALLTAGLVGRRRRRS